MAKSIHGWKLNSSGIGGLLKSDEVRSVVTARAQSVLSSAQAMAPVDSGEYRNSIHMFQATTDRAVTRVGSDADHALTIEARTGNLARALDSAGGS